MEEKLNKLYIKNKDLGFEQEKRRGSFPSQVMMINQASMRSMSPKMQEFYQHAISWTEAFAGKDLLDPNDLELVYKDPAIQQMLDLTAENYKPVPPSEKSDWSSTMLFAAENGGLGAVFLWWKDLETEEPNVVSISGGDVKVFHDLGEFLDYLVDGDFPEKGDKLYDWFEATRGTLHD